MKSITSIILKTLLLFPILTIIQGLPLMSGLNRVFIGLLFIEFAFTFKYYRYNIRDFFILILTFALHIVAAYFTSGSYYNINMVFYLIVWVYLYILIGKYPDIVISFFEKNMKYIKLIIYIWEIIVGISIIFPSCYRSGSFMSFCDKPFRLMPTTLVITALIFICHIKEKRIIYYLFLIIPAYTAFMGFSRIYFGIFILFVFVHLFYTIKNRKLLILYAILGISVVVLLFSRTSIGDKFKQTQYTSSSYYDFWGTITSGRTVFWEQDIKAFNSLPLYKKILGNGYNFVFDVNANHGYIWAHNDIINLLMNFGYLGVVVYLYAFFRMSNAILKYNKLRLATIIFYFIVFLNSMINMSYTYLCAFISYPIFIVSYVYLSGWEDSNVHHKIG